jgi:hypothetical protein
VLREGEVLASAEITNSWSDRLRGFLGRQPTDSALVLRGVRAVHTMGMRFRIDVAYCSKDLRVVDVVEGMRTWRLGRPRLSARCVIEAEAGSFERWGLVVGDQLEIKE